MPLDVGCSEELETRMAVNWNEYCGGYSRDGGESICWEGYSVSEDHEVETQLLVDKSMALHAPYQVQDLAKTTLRRESSQG